MDNYIGRLLDNRYEILEVIGNGGMAVVYKARCHRLNRLVAIKILKDELSVDAEFRRRFHAESQAVAMLSHPNIVSVYDVSHSENVDYIVMELIEGMTLKQYMQEKGVLNMKEALHFSTQIAKALEHAHSRGIIHRDIKPHNIMILKDGSVKVADFGIARVSSAQNTLTREALGSVHYISPEQAKGGKLDYRSDLYSLGVVMYEMLTGRTPYDGETPVSVAIQHINAQAVPPRTLNPQIPLGLEQITMRAMAADLEERYEDATQMLNDLDEFRRDPSVNFAVTEEPKPAPVAEPKAGPQSVADRTVHGKRPAAKKTSKGYNSAALIAGIICVVLALGFIGYFLITFFIPIGGGNKEDVEVPNFVGEVAERIDTAAYEGLVIKIDEWKNSDTIEMGRVISQEPAGGRVVKSGTTVYLTASAGPNVDTMRDLTNYMEENARTILNNLDMNLKIMVENEASDTVEKGSVIRTDPAAFQSLTSGEIVTLFISTGPNEKFVFVPELVGMDEESATELLDEAKLNYNIRYIDSEEEEGTVIFQSIKRNEEVPEGTTVNLQVSNGPAEKEPEEFEEREPSIIMLPMPEGDEMVEVTVKLDDVEIDRFDLSLATVSDDGIPIAPDAVGIHDMDVYIDGRLWYSMTYDFDLGERVQ